MKYKEIIKNTKLTKFEELKDVVVRHHVKEIPENKKQTKIKQKDEQKLLFCD